VEELIPITMFMCIAAVLILRPISKRMGALLEAMTKERLQQQAPSAVSEHQLTRVTTLLEQIARRQEQLEDRLDFTERLISTSRRGIAPPITDSVRAVDDVGLRQETLNSFRG
jgi:hypothetical protein